MSRVFALAGLALGLVGCIEVGDLPPCQFNEQCGDGQRCDLASGECVRNQGGIDPLPLPDSGPITQPPDIEWVYIPTGNFVMGSEDTADTSPTRTVAMSDFYLSRHEVTVYQYGKCVSAGRCREPLGGGLCNWGVTNRETHPINCVSWIDAAQFAAWIGARLPTEAEWEYAARGGGADVRWPWGDTEPDCSYVALTGPSTGCGTGGTLSVCLKLLGNVPDLDLCDMVGNVAEWVQDHHGPYSEAPSDGTASFSEGDRVHRGGGWPQTPGMATTRLRGRAEADMRDPALGFRVARE